MKQLSAKESGRRKLIHLATEDYFGQEVPEAGKIIKALISKKFVALDTMETFHALHISSNLSDKDYRIALMDSDTL